MRPHTPRPARVAAMAAVALLAPLAITACSSGTAQSGSGGAQTTQMYTWVSTENDRAQWQAFVDAAKEKDPNFTLTFDGPSFNDYWTKVKTRMVASDAPCILTTQPARALSAGNCEAVFAQSAADEAWARLLGRDDHVNRGGRCDRHAGVGSAAGLRLREGVWGRHCPPHTLSLQERRHRRHDRRRDG